MCLLAEGEESQPLHEVLENKFLVRIAAGSYPVPSAAGTYPLRLPACVQPIDSGPPFELGGVGSVTVGQYGSLTRY